MTVLLRTSRPLTLVMVSTAESLAPKTNMPTRVGLGLFYFMETRLAAVVR